MPITIKRFLKSQYITFSLLIILKIIIVYDIIFKSFHILKPFLYEGCYIFIIMALIELLPKRWRGVTYLIADALLTTLFSGIIVYTCYFNTLPTYYALFELKQASSVSNSIFSLMNPYYLFLYLDILVLVFFHYSKRFTFPKAMINRKGLTVTLCLSLITASILFMYYKGDKIDNPVLAAESQGILNYEVLNLYSGNQKIVPLKGDITPRTMNEKINEIKGTSAPLHPIDYGVAKGRNVIVIQMESFQNFLIGLKVNGQEVTPNLNKLLKKSMYFPKVYQQVGPGNTSDAEFMMNTSLFPSASSSTSLTYGNKVYQSLPKVLNKNGYNTMTLHVDDITFWNRDQLYPGLGFTHVYDGPKYYGKQDIVGMGPSDDILYKKGIKFLENSPKPFYSMFVTLSSHHPYKIPLAKQGLKLPAEYNNSIVGDYLQAQHYTDAAIGRFINDLKANGLWDNSVILFYGDHFGLANSELNKKDTQIINHLVGHTYTNLDRYNIPFIITIPGKTHGEVVNKVGGQLDFLPTLTNLIGINIDHSVVHFGDDLLNKKSSLIGMRYYMPGGSFFTQSSVFMPNKGFGDGSALSLKTRMPITNLSPFKKDYQKIVKLEKLSDRYLVSLPDQPNSNK